MWSDPVTRTPASGRCGAYFFRIDIKPGISCSATEISFRPQSAKPKSATLYSLAMRFSVVVPMEFLRSIISKDLDMLIEDVQPPQIAQATERSGSCADPFTAR